MINLFSIIKSSLIYRSRKVFDWLYYPVFRSGVKRKAQFLREKEIIKVAFVLTELGTWKTERLYLKMCRHPRFETKLLITRTIEGEQFYQVLLHYLQEKDYDFIEMKSGDSISSIYHPDLIFYQKPYDVSVPNQLNFRRNFYALFVFVHYGFHCINEKWALNTPLRNFSWLLFFENEKTKNSACQFMQNHAENAVITGLPMSDEFLLPLEEYADPWKDCGTPKKRIIWAPHHTIGDFDHKGINYATFFQYAEFMLELAKKYVDDIQIAFKPHPILYSRLLEYWGKEKIDAYYQAWEQGENTQLVKGRYVELFMHSDAMMHDCSSFTIEYLYAQKPVLYLTKADVDYTQNLNAFAAEAFHLHYFAEGVADVEQFVCNVIQNVDEKQGERHKFYEHSLLPPHHKSACDNIIDSILGQ